MSEAVSHYGVKGMHWGVHKKEAAEALGNLSKAGAIKKDTTKKRIGEKVKKAGGLHTVSDKDLQSFLNRMNMEKQYKSFMQEEAKRRSEGFKAAGKFLAAVGKIALPILLAGAAAKAAGPTVFRTVNEFQKGIGR